MALSKLTINTVSRGPQCTVCMALTTLPEVDAAQLTTWLADPAVPFSIIARTTRDDADTPSLNQSAIARHARGQCAAGVTVRP